MTTTYNNPLSVIFRSRGSAIMTSFMIRDILNLNSTESQIKDDHSRKFTSHLRSAPEQTADHHIKAVSTVCSRDIMSHGLCSQDMKRSCASPAGGGGSPVHQNNSSWSKNKMKVRTVFTDIQLSLIHI